MTLSYCEGGKGLGVCRVHSKNGVINHPIKKLKPSGLCAVVYDGKLFEAMGEGEPLCRIPIPLAPFVRNTCAADMAFRVHIGRVLPTGIKLRQSVPKIQGYVFAREIEGNIRTFYCSMSPDGCYLSGRFVSTSFNRGRFYPGSFIELLSADHIGFGKVTNPQIENGADRILEYMLCIEPSE